MSCDVMRGAAGRAGTSQVSQGIFPRRSLISLPLASLRVTSNYRGGRIELAAAATYAASKFSRTVAELYYLLVSNKSLSKAGKFSFQKCRWTFWSVRGLVLIPAK